MASRMTMQQALGTDGTDFQHRQRVATHYQTRWAIDNTKEKERAREKTSAWPTSFRTSSAVAIIQ